MMKDLPTEQSGEQSGEHRIHQQSWVCQECGFNMANASEPRPRACPECSSTRIDQKEAQAIRIQATSLSNLLQNGKRQ